MTTIGYRTVSKSLFRKTLTASMVALVAIASSTPFLAPSRAAVQDPRADKLLVVDCLLPGQVRRLGSTRTYLTARRPVKTSASECEIRGGEYVSYDRANYATSLKIWLPQAKEGDPEAQTYVGEIFEKGLGTEADYDAAATWYRRAAEQGYTRAQINLGQLYEQGKGVPQDMREALNWYRRASGLEDDDLQFASSVRVTMEAKEQEIKQLQEQSQRSKDEVAQLRRQLEQAQTELRSRQQELEGTRDKLDEIQRQLKQQDEAIKSSSESGMKQKQEELDAQETRLKAERTQLSELESSVAGQGAGLTDEQRKAAEKNNLLHTELMQQNAEAERLRKRLEQVEKELAESRSTLDSGSSDATLVAQLQAAENERKALEQELASRKGQIEDLRGDLSTVEGNLDQSAIEYAAAIKDLEQRKALFEVELQRVKAERDLLANKSREDVERIKQLRSELKKQESEYKVRLETLEQDYARSREQLERAKSEVAAVDGGVPVASAEPPAIELIEPPVSLTRSGNYAATIGRDIDTREVVGRITAPAGVKLFSVNEQPTTVDKNGLFNTQVPVRDYQTPVSLVVVDSVGQRVSLDFDLFRRIEEDGSKQVAKTEEDDRKNKFPHIAGLGNYYALVIGNSKYDDFPTLRTPAKDAQAVAELLEGEYGYKTQLILNANRYQIISALNDYRAKLTKGDNLLVYYAGHGEIDAVNDNGYWLPVDAEKDNTANWISTRSISEILNVMNAKQVMIVADSCYSGAMTRSALARLQAGKTVDEWVEWFKKVSKLRTRMVLSSGGEEPVNDGGGGDHSLFAQAFIQILKENDRVMDGYSVYLAVSDLVKERTKAQNLVVEQTPQYAPIKFAGHEAGEFVFQPI